jgi:hypothetical protein
MDEKPPAAMTRLDDQIAWYDGRSQRAQRWFKALKIIQLVTAGLIPLVSVLGAPEPGKISAVLGLIILIVEGLQQLNQYQANWISYRSTGEALKHEKYLFLAHAGPYADASRAPALLADRTEGLISQEHAKWVSIRENAEKAKDPPSKQPWSTTARPTAAGGLVVHVVARNDTLWSLARRYGLSVADIARFNGIDRIAMARSGDVLVIPPG